MNIMNVLLLLYITDIEWSVFIYQGLLFVTVQHRDPQWNITCSPFKLQTHNIHTNNSNLRRKKKTNEIK